MKVITYRLYLEQALLATQLAGDPNSSVSLDYIPGSLIRGALIAQYLRENKLSHTTDLHDSDKPTQAQQLFFSAKVRFLHAYPLAQGSYRCLPTPRSFLKTKHSIIDKKSTSLVFNASHPTWDNHTRWQHEQGGQEQLKPLTLPFYRYNQEEQQLYLYDLQPNHIAVHMQRKRSVGRATRNDGAVFRYEAIAPGQYFVGAIICDEDSDSDHVAQLLKKQTKDPNHLGQGLAETAPPDKQLLKDTTIWLGRSRSAQYGRTSIEFCAEEDIHEIWQEIPASLEAIEPGSTALLLFLSDAILRDQHGQYGTLLNNEVLSDHLGINVTIDQARSFVATTQLGGYNEAWQLPLPQVDAIAAGSVLSLTFLQGANATKLRDLHQQGIGDRRIEGFGRIAFLAAWNLETDAIEGYLYQKDIVLPALPEPAIHLAQSMVTRLLDQKINEATTTYVHDYTEAAHHTILPKNSQLGRVRVLVRRALVSDDPQIVLKGLASFKEVGRSQFEQAFIYNRSLWSWLHHMLTKPEDIWTTLKISEQELPKVAGQIAQYDTDLAHKTTLRLIEAVLTMLSRKRPEEVNHE